MGNSNVHNHKRCPLFLAGHGGGMLKGGLHLKAADGTPMANVFLTLAHGLGPRPAELRRQHRRVRFERGARDDGLTGSGSGRWTLVRDSGLKLKEPFRCCERLVSGLCLERGWRALSVGGAGGAAPKRRWPKRPWPATRTAVRALLKQGVDVNAAQGDGMTALHWAARQGDVELAQMLLYAGANVRATHAARRLHAAHHGAPDREARR